MIVEDFFKLLFIFIIFLYKAITNYSKIEKKTLCLFLETDDAGHILSRKISHS